MKVQQGLHSGKTVNCEPNVTISLYRLNCLKSGDQISNLTENESSEIFDAMQQCGCDLRLEVSISIIICMSPMYNYYLIYIL